jgi:hypothetical protein
LQIADYRLQIVLFAVRAITECTSARANKNGAALKAKLSAPRRL